MSEVDRQQLIQFLTNLRDFVSKLFDTYAALFGEPGQLGSATWTDLHETTTHSLRYYVANRLITGWGRDNDTPAISPPLIARSLTRCG
jgi:hypothetical protein